MTEHDDLPLDAWDAMDPPPGFADRVLAAAEAPVRPPRVRRRFLWAAAAALVALAATSLLREAPRPTEPPRALPSIVALHGARGDLAPGARVDFVLGVPRQTGRVRWLVDGEPLRVGTAAGTVHLLGTGVFVIDAVGDTTRIEVERGEALDTTTLGQLDLRAGDCGEVVLGRGVRLLRDGGKVSE